MATYGAVRQASFEIVLPDAGLYLFEVRNSGDPAQELTFSILLEPAK